MGGLGSRHPGIEIFAEAGPTVGLGHLRRMEFLVGLVKEELRANVRGFVLSAGRETDPFAATEFEILTTRQDLSQQVQADSEQGKLVVLDLKWSGFSERDIEDLMGASVPQRRFLFIDGPEVELRGSPTRLFPTFGVSNDLRQQSNVIFGPRYVFAARGGGLSGSDSCLVLTGSTAHDSFTDQVNRIASDSRLSDMPFSWGIGPFLGESRIEAKLPPNVSAHAFPKVDDVLADFSIALCRFGVSATETISRGVPTVILPGWKSYEDHSVVEIERLGLALVARSESEAIDWLSHLRIDSSLRLSIHRRAREIFQPDLRHPAIDVLEGIIEEME